MIPGELWGCNTCTLPAVCVTFLFAMYSNLCTKITTSNQQVNYWEERANHHLIQILLPFSHLQRDNQMPVQLILVILSYCQRPIFHLFLNGIARGADMIAKAEYRVQPFQGGANWKVCLKFKFKVLYCFFIVLISFKKSWRDFHKSTSF